MPEWKAWHREEQLPLDSDKGHSGALPRPYNGGSTTRHCVRSHHYRHHHRHRCRWLCWWWNQNVRIIWNSVASPGVGKVGNGRMESLARRPLCISDSHLARNLKKSQEILEISRDLAPSFDFPENLHCIRENLSPSYKCCIHRDFHLLRLKFM